jgi:uncharacterized protein YkwD
VQNRQANQGALLAAWLKYLILVLILSTPVLWGVQNPSPAYAEGDAPPPQPRPTNHVYIPSILLAGATTTAPSPDWLTYLNSYRSMAFLPALIENSSWSTGSQNHARYTVKNDILMHNEDSSNRWFTQEGMAAAQAGNLMGSYDQTASDRHAVDSWMQAPFHAIGILDPSLQQVGYGSYREGDGGIQMGATLDVLRGLGSIPSSVRYPIMWPGNGTTVPLVKFYSESPNPLTSCPNYTVPTGLPIILQVGQGEVSPRVSSFSISQGGTALESCIITEGSYTNPDGTAQESGRAILNERDGIILIPRQPLTPVAAYTVSITVNEQNYTWSFRVSAAPVD